MEKLFFIQTLSRVGASADLQTLDSEKVTYLKYGACEIKFSQPS